MTWQEHAQRDALERLERNNRERNVIPISDRMSRAEFDEIRRRFGDWALVDVDTLAPAAARDMVAELRKVNARFIANGLRVNMPLDKLIGLTRLAIIAGVVTVIIVKWGGR